MTRGAHQALAVDDLVVAPRPDGAQAGGDLGKRRRRIKRLAPAPPGDRDDLVDRRMQPHQRREGLLHQPGQARVGPRARRASVTAGM